MSREFLVAAVFSWSCSLALGLDSLIDTNNLAGEVGVEHKGKLQGWLMEPPVVPAGGVKLDSLTLDKVRSFPGIAWLVMLDWNSTDTRGTSKDYEDRAAGFDRFCANAKDAKELMIGKVPVQRMKDKASWAMNKKLVSTDPHQNEDLRKKLGATQLPAVFLFMGESEHRFDVTTTNRTFTTQNDWDDLIDWMRSRGAKVPSINTIADMDKLVDKFVDTNFSANVIEEAQKLAEGEHSHDYKAPLYVKIMKKIQKTGSGYIEQELERVTKMLESDADFLPDKKREIDAKVTILEIFYASVHPQEEPESDGRINVDTPYSGFRLTYTDEDGNKIGS